MENEKQQVTLGLDFDAREFMQFLEDEAVSSYREGFESGKKFEQEKRRVAWEKVKKEARFWTGVAIFGFLAAMFLAWCAR